MIPKLSRKLLLVLLLALPVCTGCSEKQVSVTRQDQLHYTNLDQLVSAICRDALTEFRNFYLSTGQVEVKPFLIASEHYIPETTLFSLTLADQMTAKLSSLPTLSWFNGMMKNLNVVVNRAERYEPRMEGVIEELDGYLRVHMSARNSFGEKRNFVVSAEMSEPLYQALHTRVKIYGL